MADSLPPALAVPDAEPLQYVSAYELHLYCDHKSPEHRFLDFPTSFMGETFEECEACARTLGWTIHRETRTATCPRCNRANARLAALRAGREGDANG